MMSNTIIPMITLHNGVKIPQVGLGVFRSQDGDEVEKAVGCAFDAGYRLIDTAAAYQNEVGVGKAIKRSGLSREDIFVTTKLWNADHAYNDALRAFDHSLKQLDCDYIDLYLIHFPAPIFNMYQQAWKALEKLYENKRVRAIGVSNFKPHHLDELLKDGNIVPAINQIELHPLLHQKEIQQYCLDRDILIESYSPLMEGKVLDHPIITNLAETYGKTPAQIILRWHIQSGFVVIPKSIKPNRIQENISLFDFDLSENDMQIIESMDMKQRVGVDPDTFNVK
jgi:diketogulonate reductase-like aldo/keto reductase